jgi:integrase/recombinase XerD
VPGGRRARLSFRRAEEIFEENTRLLTNPLASPEDSKGLDGWTLHRLRHSALTQRRRGLHLHSRCCWPAPADASVRSLERYARPGVDAVARHVAEHGLAARRRA